MRFLRSTGGAISDDRPYGVRVIIRTGDQMNFLVSLIMAENAYQQDQAAAASEAARRLGAHVQILYADNDAITQSQQLLNVIQSSSADSRPDAIVCHPVGTTLKQVAREAMARGMRMGALEP